MFINITANETIQYKYIFNVGNNTHINLSGKLHQLITARRKANSSSRPPRNFLIPKHFLC